MPNGTKRLSYTNTDDVKTYRDLIAQVATVLCAVCQIDRQGALVVIPFSNTPVMDRLKAGARKGSAHATRRHYKRKKH